MSSYDEGEFDLGMRRSLRIRSFRRWIIMAGIVVAFLEFKGMPHVRLTDPARGYRADAIQYWSVTGTSRYRGPHSPLIVLIPMERPVFDVATDTARALWREVLRVSG
jgi:hypothetical protein